MRRSIRGPIGLDKIKKVAGGISRHCPLNKHIIPVPTETNNFCFCSHQSKGHDEDHNDQHEEVALRAGSQAGGLRLHQLVPHLHTTSANQTLHHQASSQSECGPSIRPIRECSIKQLANQTVRPQVSSQSEGSIQHPANQSAASSIQPLRQRYQAPSQSECSIQYPANQSAASSIQLIRVQHQTSSQSKCSIKYPANQSKASSIQPIRVRHQASRQSGSAASSMQPIRVQH